MGRPMAFEGLPNVLSDLTSGSLLPGFPTHFHDRPVASWSLVNHDFSAPSYLSVISQTLPLRLSQSHQGSSRGPSLLGPCQPLLWSSASCLPSRPPRGGQTRTDGRTDGRMDENYVVLSESPSGLILKRKTSFNRQQ